MRFHLKVLIVLSLAAVAAEDNGCFCPGQNPCVGPTSYCDGAFQVCPGQSIPDCPALANPCKCLHHWDHAIYDTRCANQTGCTDCDESGENWCFPTDEECDEVVRSDTGYSEGWFKCTAEDASASAASASAASSASAGAAAGPLYNGLNYFRDPTHKDGGPAQAPGCTINYFVQRLRENGSACTKAAKKYLRGTMNKDDRCACCQHFTTDDFDTHLTCELNWTGESYNTRFTLKKECIPECNGWTAPAETLTPPTGDGCFMHAPNGCDKWKWGEIGTQWIASAGSTMNGGIEILDPSACNLYAAEMDSWCPTTGMMTHWNEPPAAVVDNGCFCPGQNPCVGPTSYCDGAFQLCPGQSIPDCPDKHTYNIVRTDAICIGGTINNVTTVNGAQSSDSTDTACRAVCTEHSECVGYQFSTQNNECVVYGGAGLENISNPGFSGQPLAGVYEITATSFNDSTTGSTCYLKVGRRSLGAGRRLLDLVSSEEGGRRLLA